MIYTDVILEKKYQKYSNLAQKIVLEAKRGTFFRVKKGIYSDDISKDSMALANCCYGPSYISFEYALSYYGLIPEYVSIITSATMNKRRSKRYATDRIILEYHDIPEKVFPLYTVFHKTETGYGYRMACREKALCDELYLKYPVRSIKDLKILLFEDLRMDEEEFLHLDQQILLELCPLYQSSSLDVLAKYLRSIKK